MHIYLQQPDNKCKQKSTDISVLMVYFNFRKS